MFRITFIIAFVLLSIYTNAQEADKTVSITVSGSGKTQDLAKQFALRSAIEQAFGTFISSKTEILNDQVIADQIISVSSGNIQSYTLLNESQLPNESWGVTIKAIVSVSKLTSFVESKGIAIEIKGGLFALNIKQQKLNEEGEVKAISEMVGLIHEPMQISFDYIISNGSPKSIDADSKKWEIPLVVTAKTNKNIDFCANYCMNTLSSIGLSAEEVATYKSLNKSVFPITINYFGRMAPVTYYLRKKASLKALESLGSNWEFYNRLFTVESSIKKLNGIGETNKLTRFLEKPKDDRNIAITLNFLTKNQEASIFKWNDLLTLEQVEKIDGYKVMSRGTVSPFKHGGYVISEFNGHGLIMALSDLEGDLFKGNMDWDSAKKAVNNLVLNGYSDWHLPTEEDFNKIIQNKLAGGLILSSPDTIHYLSSSKSSNNGVRILFVQRDISFGELSLPVFGHVRPVRTF